jgi:hypothetical protein
VRVVTVRSGWRTKQAVRTTLRMCLTVFARAYCRAWTWETSAGRGRGCETTWAAPAPITAPPQVQAHNFAKAILTDIAAPCSKASNTVRVEEDRHPSAVSGYRQRERRFV